MLYIINGNNIGPVSLSAGIPLRICHSAHLKLSDARAFTFIRSIKAYWGPCTTVSTPLYGDAAIIFCKLFALRDPVKAQPYWPKHPERGSKHPACLLRKRGAKTIRY